MLGRSIGTIAAVTVVIVLGTTGCGSGNQPAKPSSVSPSSLAGNPSPVSPAQGPTSQTRPTAAQISVEVGGVASADEASMLAPLATSPEVLSNVIRALGLTISQVTLAHMISASVDTGMGYILIQAMGARAVEIANTDAVNLIQIASATAPTANLKVVHPAAPQ